MPVMQSKTVVGSRVGTGGHQLVGSLTPWSSGTVNIIAIDPIIQPATNHSSVNGLEYACVAMSDSPYLFGWVGTNDLKHGNFPVEYGPQGGIGWRGVGDDPATLLLPDDVCLPLPPSGVTLDMYARVALGEPYEFLLTVYYTDSQEPQLKLHRHTWYRTEMADPLYVLFEHPWEDVPIKMRGAEVLMRYGPDVAVMACCNNHVPDIFAWSLGNRRRLRRFFGRNTYIPFPAAGGSNPPHIDCHAKFVPPGPFGLFYTMHYTRDDEE